MKKFIVLLFCLCFIFTGCNNFSFKKDSTDLPDNEKTVSESSLPELRIGYYADNEYSKEHSKIMSSVSYEKLFLSSETEKKYPDLASAIEEFNDETESNQLEIYESNSEYAEEAIDNNPENFFELTSDHNMNIVRADEKVICVLNHSSSYSGGAHGYSGSYGKNFYTGTGEEIPLSDIITDMDALPGIIEDEIIRWRNEDKSYFEENLDMEDIFDEDEINWILGHEGITFIFNPYEIASYAQGKILAPVLYEEYPEIFNDEFFDIEKNYFSELESYFNYYTDFDNDGETDELLVYHDYAEDGIFKRMVIEFNGEKTEFECRTYSLSPTLVHLENGKNLIYAEYEYENGFREIEVFEYEDGEFINTESFSLGRNILSTNDTEYEYLRLAMTNPDSFRLSRKTDVLGTSFGTINCYVDENGHPTSDDTVFRIADKKEFELMKDIEVFVNGKEKKLKKGEKVTYYGTDNKTFAELVLQDKTIARVYIEAEGWPKTIEGTDITEIFDGLEFAG